MDLHASMHQSVRAITYGQVQVCGGLGARVEREYISLCVCSAVTANSLSCRVEHGKQSKRGCE